MTKTISGLLLSTLLISVTAANQMQSLSPQDTFAASRLSQKEIRQIRDEVEQSAYDTPESWEKELRVKRVDLGKRSGLVVRGTNLLCGATGNCQTWIFQKIRDRWVSLFPKDQVPVIESFCLGPSITAEIKDLTVSANLSAQSVQTITYQFDGKFYRAK